MKKVLLSVFLFVYTAVAVEVVMKYVPPELILRLPIDDKEVVDVDFYFNAKHVLYHGKGKNTSNGWEYRTSTADLDGAGAVYGWAQILHYNGSSIYTTTHTFLSLEHPSTEVLQPNRVVRGAAYFRDDFNNINRANWNYEVSMYGGYNGEFQVYTNDNKNVFTRDGHLFIYPIPTVNDNRFNENFLHTGKMDLTALFGYCTEPDLNGCVRDGHNGILPPVMSGKLKSVPTMKFGIMEVRARIPKGDWLWPALWLLPKQDHYGQWPRSGEIDVMESWGNSGDIGVKTVTSTLHWGPSADQNRFMKTHGEKKSASWHDDYHTWRLEWTPDHIRTFVDNQQIVSVDPGSGGFWGYGGFSGANLWAGGSKMAPFDQDFYMIMNVAVGGTSGFFPDDVNYGVRKPWTNGAPNAAEQFWNGRNDWLPSWQGDNVAMLVDYVEFRYP